MAGSDTTAQERAPGAPDPLFVPGSGGPGSDGDDAAEGNWLFDRLPPWVIDTLSTEQRTAIHNAVNDPSWRTHPIDVRLSMPLLGRRFYLTMVGGQEKRSAERRARERHRYPLRTIANLFFFVGLVTLFYMVALVGLAVHSAIVEF